MKKVTTTIILLLFCIICVNGDWKFWKKSTTTTVAPDSTSTTTTTTPLPLLLNPTTSTTKPGSQQQSINSNRGKQQRPNPGTDVGLDFPQTKPARPGAVGSNGQPYRNWAIDITGAGEPARNPALPNSQNLPRQNEPQPKPPQAQTSTQKAVTSTSTTTQKPTTSSTTPKTAFTTTTAPRTTTRRNGQNNFPALPGRTGAEQQPAQPTRGPSYANIAARPGSPTQPPRPNSGSSANAPANIVPGQRMFVSNPTYSKGNTVTDEDLEKLSEALFIKDSNNANKHITLNLQKKTTGSSTTDEAPQPLLQVNAQALQSPTVQRVLTIFDNYHLDTKTNEHISAQQREEESLLVDTFLSTNLMSAAMRFLADKGLVKKDYYEYKDLLRRLWFNLFSRGEGKIGSSGFEHVFLSELRGDEVLGLHNWIYFNAEETKNEANYLGYIKKVDLGDKASILKIHVKMNDKIKPITTMFVGTSPELEMALYTVCFMTRPDQSCPVSLGGTKFNIVTHKFKYRGNDLVGSAYPDI